MRINLFSSNLITPLLLTNFFDALGLDGFEKSPNADLNASANAYDRAMAAFLSKGNFEGASVGELDSIREQVGFQDTTGLEG